MSIEPDVVGIAAHFAALHQQDPKRPLINLPELQRTLTAADLWRQHHEFLRVLERLQLDEGDLLVCGTGNRPELLAVLIACRVRNVTLMAVDTGATYAELQTLCSRFGAKGLLTSAAIGPGEGQTSAMARELAVTRCQGESVSYPGAALLKLTSGTSGLARAIRTTEAQLIADGTQIMAAMRIGPDDTQLAAIPLAHSYGLGAVVMPLLLQGTAIVLRESFVPHQLPADAERYKARRLPGVPFMFEYLIEHPPADGWPAGLTRLVSAGAALAPPVVHAFHDRFGVKVHSFYGTTETGGISFDDSDEIGATTGVGRPVPGVVLSMRSQDGLPPGLGRVHVQSPAVSDGYVGSERGDFTDDGFLTGDYGSIGPDGRLTLAGRVSSFINVAGRKVQPEEVEAVLKTMPGIADARVTGTFDSKRGEQVVAFLVPRTGTDTHSQVEVRRFCSTQLAAHKIPRLIFFVESIPLNARGKTDRAGLDALLRRLTGESP